MSTTKFARPAVVYIAAGLLSHAGAYYLGLSAPTEHSVPEAFRLSSVAPHRE